MEKKIRKLDHQKKIRLEQDVLAQRATIINAKNELIIERDSLRNKINDLESEINMFQKREDSIELLYEVIHSIAEE